MLRYAISRLLSSIPTMLLVITLAFALTRVAPGGPFDELRRLPPAVEAALDKAYHLDEPIVQQYKRYLGGVLRGDLGPSFRYQDTMVSDLITASLPVSFFLGVAAMLAALVVGIGAGSYAALKRNHWQDRLIMAFAMTGISIPNFVVAPVLVLIFAVMLRWLPAGNLGGPQHYVMPVIALALPQIAYIARLTRASMVEVLSSNFIRTARAQGLGTWALISRHALKPALLPIVSYLGPATAAILTGSVVVEQIFALPGVGRLFVAAAGNRDYTLVMGIVVFYGLLVIALNFVVDLLYGWLDPRVRYQ